MPNEKVWTREELITMWPQAKDELRGFQRHLERKAGITASQLGMALQLAEAGFEGLRSGSVVAEVNLPCANTQIEPKTIGDLLREKCQKICDSEAEGIELWCCPEVDRIAEGLKRVSFDFENHTSDSSNAVGEFRNLLGPRHFGRIPALGCAAGGDWEYPVFFIIYMDLDGITLRSYVPKDGNTWNYDTGSAFGSNEKADVKFLSEWVTSNRPELSLEAVEANPIDSADVMFDEDKIIKDIEDTIWV